jgi:hypothetical protein
VADLKRSAKMKASLLFLGLVVGLGAADRPSTIEEVACRGVIEEFVKEGFHGDSFTGPGETFDITWVRVREPEEFAGVRQMLLSRPSGKSSPFGKVGDVISFRSPRATLESESGRTKKPNQSLQPTAPSGRG